MGRWSALPLLLLLAACSQKPADAPVAYLELDCAQPFDAQVAAITAQPKLVPAGNVGAEPYSYYSSADGSVSFLLGNAVDDAAMRITLVLRGDDHLTNTPRQILLQRLRESMAALPAKKVPRDMA